MLNPTSPYGKFYVEGNILVGNTGASADNWIGVKADHPDSARASQPFSVEVIKYKNAEAEYELVLRNSGASLRRDGIDTRIVREVREGTALYGTDKKGIIDSQVDVGGWPELKSSAPLKDSDADGMPDAWEVKNKLNPDNAADATVKPLHGGYDNIEVYLNSIVKVIE